MSYKQSNEVFRGDLVNIDSLDSEASRAIFSGLVKWRPTLDMALRAAKIKNYDIVLEDSRILATAAVRKNPEIAKFCLSDDEAGAISCYTLEGTAEGKTPYQVINDGLAVSRNGAGLSSIRRLLFLLLSGLRKLPRTRPSAGQIFYRGIRVKVPRTENEANGHQYYEKGRTVTWWGFTSTTTNMEVVNEFIRGAAASTVFHIGGEDLWGYDIKAFSEYPKEEEILLEPEAKVFVKGSMNLGPLLMTEVTLQPFDHLVLEDIIPVGNASPIPTQIGQPSIIKKGSGESFSEIQGKSAIYGQTSNIQKKWDCAWKECPSHVNQMAKYSVDPYNPRIVTKVSNDLFGCYCTIIGNTSIPLNIVTSWSIKVLKSKNNDRDLIFIGVAPSDINQNGYDYNTMCGWYLHCKDSTLWSGPPHNYRDKGYGPRMMGLGGCFMNVGVVIDAIKGEISFILSGVDLGVAYERIPLNKPLVPCVLLWKSGDSVELDTSEVKENEVGSSIPVPSNITAKSTTWDSITLAWDEVGGASYEIEVDGSKSLEPATTNLFTKRELLPKTEHSFRVRVVKEGSVSKWSNIVKGKTRKESFETSAWKKCLDDVEEKRKYVVDAENSKIAIKVNSDGCCTIIGNTYIPLNKIISWNIKIHKSRYNDGGSIYIGVAPFDINQNDDNYNNGWYFNCFSSSLFSGLPHNYRNKEYGPRKGSSGQYVHAGDSVGVVVDTTRGELSFVLNGANLGVAYEGIPLDEPLVPCVILWYKGDSIELDISEVKENVDSSIPVPSNIKTKNIIWDSITLTWDKVSNAAYEIEVDGNKSLELTTTNSFTKKGLHPETEHSFRVRAVRGSSESEWSGVLKVRTLKAPNKWNCAWKACPTDVEYNRKYAVDERNPMIATKINNSWHYAIKGNTSIPPNKVVSWNIKVLKSKKNNGDYIYIGVAPFFNNPNIRNSFDCGWYFGCYDSRLDFRFPNYSCPEKTYGPRKEDGEYVHTGDSVGVMMDTTRGDLSFVLNNVNLGIAYEGIPLDEPLVPCVILQNEGDSVELDTTEVKENEVDSSVPVPSNITAKDTTWDSITLTWNEVDDASFYQIEVDGNKSWGATTKNLFVKRGLLPETEHSFRMRAVRGSSASEWSDVVKGRTLKAPEFSECVWKECPVDVVSKYCVYGRNTRIAKNINYGVGLFSECSTIIGNTHIPLNTVTSWSIKILKSENNNGENIYIGIAPFDINQNVVNYNKCGWYFECYNSALYSGPPHNYRWGKEYGPRKGDGQYVHTGDSVGVVADTTKGELSFVLNGVNLGVAYEGIPLDKPLVPCVILGCDGDSIEIDTSEVKENKVGSSIPVPSNIIAKSTTWDSITLAWVEFIGVSSYQIEVDGSKSWDITTTSTFTKRGLLPETEHSFRVRSVRWGSVSEWSGVVKGRTLKESFETSAWKTCPVDVVSKYCVYGRNTRIAKNINYGVGLFSECSTIIGNTHIPLNTVTSWSIKILKSENNNGENIYIGIAPFDINQNVVNYNKCGWYFECYNSALYSGPPHNYSWPSKEYGPRKGDGQHVHTGDSVGVVVDTTKGELSFVLDGVNYGAAYEGIPLDEPLVPCVLLGCDGDSIELDTSEVKENVDSSVPVLSNIAAKSTTWDSITFTWNESEDASFYQIEVDGSKSWGTITANSFTKRGLLPETEHSFRMRAMRGSSVSEWSGVVKGRTLKAPEFPECVWKKCPGDVDDGIKYSVDERNLRVATKINDGDYDIVRLLYCTTIGNTPIPLNTVTSWSIKVLKSRNNDGQYIYIGVAPFDINQKDAYNYNKCGWYFNCYSSKLDSGSPHNYLSEEYGPRKGDEQYVHTKDSVGVVMDTTKGDLSFILNGVNLGVAYEGIPLDKPLVPCVLLGCDGDSVEFNIKIKKSRNPFKTHFKF